jgi:hypothetical protein
MRFFNKFVLLLGYLVLFLLIYFSYKTFFDKKPSHHHSDSNEKLESRNESQEITFNLETGKGNEVGFVYETFLSPHQEGGEEEDMPFFIPKAFHSTLPSVSRNNRKSKGHSLLSFSKDLSKATLYLSIQNVDIQTINMLHIHCGRPGQLGPILVDISLIGNLQEYLSDSILKLEIRNEDIVATSNHGQGLVSLFTAGCPIMLPLFFDKVKTIAGMEYIAKQGDLYLNLHTKAQTFYGDIRGQYQAKTK